MFDTIVCVHTSHEKLGYCISKIHFYICLQGLHTLATLSRKTSHINANNPLHQLEMKGIAISPTL